MNKQRTYLQDILKRVAMIERFTAGGREVFLNSEMMQESVIRCYEVIGEIVKRLDPALSNTQPHIPWKNIAGFRDVLIHRYDEIEPEVIWKAVDQDLPALKAAVETMLTNLAGSENNE
jgi:uncharacterized protein with HEPN domain